MKTAKRQLNKHDAAEETTKRLESIMASFDAFDADMRIGTRQRREKDEFKVFTMCARGVPRRCLHFNTTRGHLTMPWVVSFLRKRPFGPLPVNTMLPRRSSRSPGGPS